MPGLDGLEVCTRLHDLDARVPVVLITGHPNPAIRARARAAGIPLVDKPLAFDALLGLLARTPPETPPETPPRRHAPRPSPSRPDQTRRKPDRQTGARRRARGRATLAEATAAPACGGGRSQGPCALRHSVRPSKRTGPRRSCLHGTTICQAYS
ncbi:hypothetical protein [Methylobacterium sp. XJLW]|uniref:hypothetical protein n=1 Tax=Methylobacterium sp. XJLW TaxID=739141 RepID=UPI003FA55CEA